MNFLKIYFLLICVLIGISALSIVWADKKGSEQEEQEKRSWISSWFDVDDDDEEDDHDHEDERRTGNGPRLDSIASVPPIYVEECGTCHMAYQAELLPSVSWQELMEGLENHFGEDASIEETSRAEILQHLRTFAAERSKSVLGRKLARSAGSRVYLRISEIPKIKHEHTEEFSVDVLNHPSIKSVANCSACHQGALKGNYDEELISIPR